nr:pentatricopeptide repeat-containing protein At2g37310 [Coffea arabica]
MMLAKTLRLHMQVQTAAAINCCPRQALPIFIPRHPIDYAFYGHLIQHCTDHQLVRQAKQLHARLVLCSTILDNFLASKLITFYSKNHLLREAHHVFDHIPQKNTFSWNALLIAYSLHNRYEEALTLFSSFLSVNSNSVSAKPDGFTVTCVLKALAAVTTHSVFADIMHCYVVKKRIDADVFVVNGLITCYSRCDDMVSARYLFDEMPCRDLVSWNSMISGYSQVGYYEECKLLYREMLDSKEFRPNGVTVVSVLQACAQSNDLVLGMDVHRYVIESGIEVDLSVCNSIISLYAKSGSLDYARELFEEMSEKDEVTYGAIISGYMVHGFVDKAVALFREMRSPRLSTWNAVISGHVQNNQRVAALDLVREMQKLGCRPNSVTLSSVLPTLSYLSYLKGGKEMHAYAIRNNCDGNVYVATAIIDTYSKLGFIDGAQSVFDRTVCRSLIIWTAIISAHAAHGDASVALRLFNEMLNSGLQPDPVTITAVLSACSHAGLVREAWGIFHSLVPKYGIQPSAEHYACMVGVLSRAAKLSEALNLINGMPIKPSAKVWGPLLDAASLSGNVELGKFICDHLFQLEPENTGNYVIMANLYSKAGRWEEAEVIREKMKNIGMKKVAGSSWIENHGGLQSLILEDVSDEKSE